MPTSGHTRRVQIPDCVSFEITTNACRGYCVSYSVPSGEETTAYNPKQIITSVGQCCNILEYEEDVSSFNLHLSSARFSLPPLVHFTSPALHLMVIHRIRYCSSSSCHSYTNSYTTITTSLLPFFFMSDTSSVPSQ